MGSVTVPMRENWREVVRRYAHNGVIDGSVRILWKTENGIYYWHEYIPERFHEGYAQNDMVIKAWIFALKVGKFYCVAFFAKEIINAVKLICDLKKNAMVLLIAVPRSRPELPNGVAQAVGMVSDMSLTSLSCGDMRFVTKDGDEIFREQVVD